MKRLKENKELFKNRLGPTVRKFPPQAPNVSAGPPRF